MALQIGDADCTSGLAKRMYDNWTGDTDNNAFGAVEASLPAAQRKAIKSMCYQFARAIVAEIQANGVAEISTSLGELQVTTTAGADTDPPKGTRTIPLK